ncbi:MAG: hypothetical protein IH859_00505 [Chloroflexi bacterium]|nr:hypothetical protein [Chloroflexota bacterium]
MADLIEILWDDLFSRESSRIQQAFDTLNAEERTAILAHLKRMSSEPDWHPEQVRSAKAALQALESTDGRL